MAKAAQTAAFPLDAEVARSFSEWGLYLVFHMRELEKVAAVSSPASAPAPHSAKVVRPPEEVVTVVATDEGSGEGELTLESLGLS